MPYGVGASGTDGRVTEEWVKFRELDAKEGMQWRGGAMPLSPLASRKTIFLLSLCLNKANRSVDS